LKNIWKVKNIKYSDHQFFDLLANLIYQPKALSSKVMKNEFRWFYIDSKYEGSECIPKKWHTNMFGIGGFFRDEILHYDDKENIQCKIYKILAMF